MFKIFLSLAASLIFILGYTLKPNLNALYTGKGPRNIDSPMPVVVEPEGVDDLDTIRYTGPDITPSPACLAAAPTGELFVGVDMIGSLGKTPGKGSIIKLYDEDNDGKVDKHTTFAMVDNPRGIFVLGDQVFVLHTTFSKETAKASGMDLVVYEDKDRNGIADGPSKPLIQNISSAKFLQSRGTDHATNGIRMGIDGWIYIAVGDFGFYNAVDRSGKKLTMQGGGIVRVRPDGTEMEIFSHGMRNIYDVAIDPYMNIFTRDNTNDGGGWNIRFSHQIQSGEYGYPLLFQHFTNEIIPALADLGGGSGTGALFMDDPAWPDKYNHVPMMADWGRNQLFIHRITPDGASYTQKEEEFIKLPQITDVDVDASGRMYLSAWDGAGYSGNPAKGYVLRVVPKKWKYSAFPDLKKCGTAELVALMKSVSSVARLHAQQELITRPGADGIAWALAADKGMPLYSRVAAIFAYAQSAGDKRIDNLSKLIADKDVKEYVLRALTDRKTNLKNVALKPFIDGAADPDPRVQVAALIGLGRLGRAEAIPVLLNVKVPPSFIEPNKDSEGPHATPNAAIIPSHIAVRSLIALKAVDACIAAIGKKGSTIALWALRYMHDQKAVNGLIAAYKKTTDKKLKKQILTTLARLYHKEASYDGTTWWSTRPVINGPYYKNESWASSPLIEKFLTHEWAGSNKEDKQFYADINKRLYLEIAAFGGLESVAAKEEIKVDFNKIKNKKGQIGQASIEDIMLAIANIKGDTSKGKALFTQQGCVACHSIRKGEPLKGPFMGQIGSIMNKERIAESILKPNASISQGFATVLVTAKGEKSYMGFVTEESAEKLVMRNIAGQVFTVKTSDIISRKELETSMMPAGLANALSYEEFASLVSFLSEQKK